MALTTMTMDFESMDAFLEWKEQEERETHTWYIQRCGAKLGTENEHWYYYCNRAGKYQARGKNERSLKSQGTSKITSHCSAYIKATRNIKTNNVTVEYNSTHYNHATQLGHLHIDKTTRMMIASKLNQGVTSQRILDDIRDTQDNTNMSRKRLVCRKDISNIKRQFNIEGVQRHTNDLISVTSWVEEMEMLEYNPILFFKQQGQQPFPTCDRLETHDFLLVMQTEFQRDMFCKYAHNVVCMDATYKTNDYEFNLITLMVLDDYQEGIPTLWALSNREDKSVLLYILEALKERCGVVSTNWFMSDMAQQYFSAWTEVLGAKHTRYLWCAWHVDRAWKDGLKRHISNKKQQRDIYHHLRILMMETDIAKFRQLLAQLLTLTLSIAPSFSTYFKDTYCTHVEQWATCYRVGTPMNTNMFSESFHRVLKVVYLQHKHNRRVDFLLYTLLKIARDKAFDQLQKCQKGKHTHRICDINK